MGLLLRLANVIQPHILIGHLYSSDVVRPKSTKEHQKYKHLNEIGLRIQNLLIIMNPIPHVTMQRTQHLPWWVSAQCVGTQPTNSLVPLESLQYNAKHS